MTNHYTTIDCEDCKWQKQCSKFKSKADAKTCGEDVAFSCSDFEECQVEDRKVIE